MINATKRRNPAMVSLALASLLLAGCTATAGSPNAVESAATTAAAPTSDAAPAGIAPSTDTAAMHASGQHATGQTSGPSEASKMICAQETKDDISAILALNGAPHTVDGWADSTYTCTYHLADGPLVISVRQSADPAGARTYFDALQAKLRAAPIKGLANLGFPAAQTTDGSVVFLKDNSTLHVDASRLPTDVGPQNVTRTDFAYQVATTILGCWKEHH
jgi:hypothetical protein